MRQNLAARSVNEWSLPANLTEAHTYAHNNNNNINNKRTLLVHWKKKTLQAYNNKRVKGSFEKLLGEKIQHILQLSC